MPKQSHMITMTLRWLVMNKPSQSSNWAPIAPQKIFFRPYLSPNQGTQSSVIAHPTKKEAPIQPTFQSSTQVSDSFYYQLSRVSSESQSKSQLMMAGSLLQMFSLVHSGGEITELSYLQMQLGSCVRQPVSQTNQLVDESPKVRAKYASTQKKPQPPSSAQYSSTASSRYELELLFCSL